MFHCVQITLIDSGVNHPRVSLLSPSDYPTIMGFEPLFNQRLLPPTFPRYTKIRGRADTMTYLEGLVTRLQTVCEVTTLAGLHTALVSDLLTSLV